MRVEELSLSRGTRNFCSRFLACRRNIAHNDDLHKNSHFQIISSRSGNNTVVTDTTAVHLPLYLVVMQIYKRLPVSGSDEYS